MPTSTVQQFVIKQGPRDPVLLHAGASSKPPSTHIRTQLQQRSSTKPTLYQQIRFPSQSTQQSEASPQPAPQATQAIQAGTQATPRQQPQKKIQISQQALEQIKKQIAVQQAMQAAQGRQSSVSASPAAVPGQIGIVTASPVKSVASGASVNQLATGQTRYGC